MKEFAIAYGKSKEELLNTMSAAVADGWEPVGGLATFGLEICIGIQREARPKKLIDTDGNVLGEQLVGDIRQPITIGEFKYMIVRMDAASATLQKVPNIEVKVVEQPANEPKVEAPADPQAVAAAASATVTASADSAAAAVVGDKAA